MSTPLLPYGADHQVENPTIPERIEDREFWCATLPFTTDLARSASAEITFGDLKAVFGFDEDL